MSRKVVSPKSIQKIVVLNREHGPLTIHKRRAKSKLPKSMRRLLKDTPFEQGADMVGDMTGAIRMAKRMADVARAFRAMAPMQMPMPPMMKFGW